MKAITDNQTSCLSFMYPNMLSAPNGLALGVASAAVMMPPTSMATRLANGNALKVETSEPFRSFAHRLKSAVTVPASTNSVRTMVSPTPIDIEPVPSAPAYDMTAAQPWLATASPATQTPSTTKSGTETRPM